VSHSPAGLRSCGFAAVRPAAMISIDCCMALSSSRAAAAATADNWVIPLLYINLYSSKKTVAHKNTTAKA